MEDLVVVTTIGRDNPRAYFFYEHKKQELNLLSFGYSKKQPEYLGVPATVNIKARDGVKIKSYILFPPHYESGKNTQW